MKVSEFLDALSKLDPDRDVLAPEWDGIFRPVRLQEWGSDAVAIFPIEDRKDVDPEAVIPSVCFDDGEYLNLHPDTWISFGDLVFMFNPDGTVGIEPWSVVFQKM